VDKVRWIADSSRYLSQKRRRTASPRRLHCSVSIFHSEGKVKILGSHEMAPSACLFGVSSCSFPSKPFNIFVVPLWTLYNSLCLFCIMALKTACSTQGEAASMQWPVGQPLSLTVYQCCAWCTLGYSWSSWLPEHNVFLCSTCHWPKSLNSFQWSWSPVFHPPVCMYNQGCCPFQGAESSTCSCWISCGWWLLRSLICLEHSARPFQPWWSQQFLPI